MKSGDLFSFLPSRNLQEPSECCNRRLCAVIVSVLCRFGSGPALAAVDTTKQKRNPVPLCVWWVILNPGVIADGFGPVLLCFNVLVLLFSI